MKYRKEIFYQYKRDYGDVCGVAIYSRNNKLVAKCNTDYMADRIIKGLGLLAEEEKRRANFRL